jgi:two-component system response regulator HydG
MPSLHPLRILVADDDASVLEAFSALLTAEGHTVVGAGDERTALDAVRTKQPDVAFLDLRMPGRPTVDWLPEVARLDPDLPVVIVTGFGTIELAVAAMRAGAYDFVEKPVRRDVFLAVLRRAGEHRRMRREIARLQSALEGNALDSLLGESPAMARLREDIARIASSPLTTVLVLGESGTGKELVARAIHAATPRREARAPFVAVNCAALAPSLLEAELFGHERGAFTGAAPEGRAGLFEQAGGGTLFLDEVGELGLPLQGKLLRVLEDRAVRRLGACQDRHVELRVVAATNKDVFREAQEHRFRQDLYYRLAVVAVRVPALRERGDDAWLLANRFFEEIRARLGRRLTGFAPGAERAIRTYAWPGNVRELRNAVERACIAARGMQIAAADLSLTPVAERSRTVVRPILEVERELVEAALAEARGCVSTAARLLGIHRTTLHRKLESLKGASPLTTAAPPAAQAAESA